MRVVLASSAVVAVFAAIYCPSSNDLMVAYGDNVQLTNQGWTVNGGGAAATKTAFNLNDGYVEYDMDVSRSNSGVIPNIYSISPSGLGGGGYDTDDKYCDGAENERPWCIEMDWMESNGGCGGATTWHTIAGHDSDGCTAYGCRISSHHNSPTFHMKVSYDGSGNPTVMKDGQIQSGFSPAPEGGFAGKVRSAHASTGAVVYSSQWTSAWVPPPDDCPGSGGNGDLPGSSFSISNLRISGSVVQGPEPTRCSGPQPTPGPSPGPTPGGQCQTFYGKNNDGTNLKSSADYANSADECCSKCGEASGCVGYTWVHKLNECWLKSAVGAPRDDACGGCVTSGTYSAPAPTPSPGPRPSPGPSPHTGCPGGSLAACIQTCPSSNPVVFETCVGECQVRCSGPSCTGGDDGNNLTDCLSGCPTETYADCVGCCASKFPSFVQFPSVVL